MATEKAYMTPSKEAKMQDTVHLLIENYHRGLVSRIQLENCLLHFENRYFSNESQVRFLKLARDIFRSSRGHTWKSC